MDTIIPASCAPDVTHIDIGCVYGPWIDLAKTFGWPPGVRLERVYTNSDGKVVGLQGRRVKSPPSLVNTF